jgi:hypothetical protein
MGSCRGGQLRQSNAVKGVLNQRERESFYPLAFVAEGEGCFGAPGEAQKDLRHRAKQVPLPNAHAVGDSQRRAADSFSHLELANPDIRQARHYEEQ